MTWQIDPAHSSIQFTVRHMMISKVRGNFEKFSGTIDFTEENPANSTVSVEIDAASINTREEQRDGHLKSPDFLNVAEFPTLTFKSTRVEPSSSDEGKLIGDLTIRDITKEVVLDVEYVGKAKSPWGTTSAGFSGSTTINRTDWGLTWNQTLETGGILVGDKIKIDIELELIEVAEQEAVAA
ncbi:MAG: YceI family protein [Anaerolineales bacterium]|nr:YceI family protein [Anaerolineales bacterium]